MDEVVAASIIQKIRSLDGLLNEIDAGLRQIPADDERQTLLRSLARAVLELDTGIVRPIARKYPHPDPDK